MEYNIVKLIWYVVNSPGINLILNPKDYFVKLNMK